MARTLTLTATVTVTLDAGGSGSAAVGLYFPAVPGLATPGAATPGDPGGLVSFAGAGAATAFVMPLSPGEVWTDLVVSVRVATNASEAGCSIYAGAAPTAGYFADATTWGSTGDSTTNVGPVRVGGAVWAVWTGGDPGARATLTVRGTRTVA